jgi:hypothetical protein
MRMHCRGLDALASLQVRQSPGELTADHTRLTSSALETAKGAPENTTRRKALCRACRALTSVAHSCANAPEAQLCEKGSGSTGIHKETQSALPRETRALCCQPTFTQLCTCTRSTSKSRDCAKKDSDNVQIAYRSLVNDVPKQHMCPSRDALCSYRSGNLLQQGSDISPIHIVGGQGWDTSPSTLL